MLVRIPPAFDPAVSLARFSHWGDDLMDRWDGSRFRRPLRSGPCLWAISLRFPAAGLAEVQFGPGPAPALVVAAVQAMFGDSQRELARLGTIDPVVADLRARYPGLRPVLYLDPLGALVASVTAQQVNLAFAVSVRRELLRRFGTELTVGESVVLAPDPVALAGASLAELRSLRLTANKSLCLRGLGQAVCDGALDLDALRGLADAAVVERLVALPGIGRWTALQFLGRVLGRPVLVAEDLGVQKAVQLAYQLGARPTAIEVAQLTSHYGGAALAAQQLLLHALSSRGSGPALRRVVPTPNSAAPRGRPPRG